LQLILSISNHRKWVDEQKLNMKVTKTPKVHRKRVTLFWNSQEAQKMGRTFESPFHHKNQSNSPVQGGITIYSYPDVKKEDVKQLPIIEQHAALEKPSDIPTL